MRVNEQDGFQLSQFSSVTSPMSLETTKIDKQLAGLLNSHFKKIY